MVNYGITESAVRTVVHPVESLIKHSNTDACMNCISYVTHVAAVSHLSMQVGAPKLLKNGKPNLNRAREY